MVVLALRCLIKPILKSQELSDSHEFYNLLNILIFISQMRMTTCSCRYLPAIVHRPGAVIRMLSALAVQSAEYTSASADGDILVLGHREIVMVSFRLKEPCHGDFAVS